MEKEVSRVIKIVRSEWFLNHAIQGAGCYPVPIFSLAAVIALVMGPEVEMLKIHQRIYDLAKPHLNTRRNDVHVENSYRLACRLLEDEPGDPDVVIPAILCHDLGWIRVPEHLQLKAFGPTFDPDLRRIHEIEGVKLARDILGQVNYDPIKTAEILDIIDGHDSRPQGISDSDKIVKDADKLFRFTETGLAIDIERFQQSRGSYLKWIFAQIDSWFLTTTGKQLALELMQKMRLVCISEELKG